MSSINLARSQTMGPEEFAVYCYNASPAVRVVGLNSDDLARANKFHDKIVVTKMGEERYKVDHDSLNTRMVTGALGEIAVEKLVGIRFFDESVGSSEKYNHPDISSENIGVKTVEFGKLPVVPIRGMNHYPQIICVLANPNTVVVCGVATPDVLDKHQSLDLILSKNLRNRKVKSGFYGFDHLIPIDEYFTFPPKPNCSAINWSPKLVDCRNVA